MVSSTFTDLQQHRAELIKAIDRQDLKSVGMEHDSAKPGIDVIGSSLKMVQDASAYVGVISHKYGQIPEDPSRNPQKLSLTELEFDEAQKLNRPILLFIMGDEHDVKPRDIERDPEKFEKLGVDIPDLPPYDLTKDEKLPWEDEVAAAIEKLKAEAEAEKAAEKQE